MVAKNFYKASVDGAPPDSSTKLRKQTHLQAAAKPIYCRKKINMLFTGLGRSVWEKTVPLVLSTRPRAQFFPIPTSRPVNNIYILTTQAWPIKNTISLQGTVVNYKWTIVALQPIKLAKHQIRAGFGFPFPNLELNVPHILYVKSSIHCPTRNSDGQSEDNAYMHIGNKTEEYTLSRTGLTIKSHYALNTKFITEYL